MSATLGTDVRQDERLWQNETGWTYQERAHARAGTRFVLERQFARIAEALAPAPGEHALDLGCGTGFLADWMGRHTPARWYGADLSLSAVRKAGERSPGLGFSTGDAERLPFRDGAFHHVVCNGSAHHFLDLDAAMREVFRILAPGGRLVLFEPVATVLGEAVRQGLFRNSKYESPADLAHKHEFTRRGVEESLARCGFLGVRGGFRDFLAYPLTGMYMALPWSEWRGLFRALCLAESAIERVASLRPACDLVSWRLLLAAEKPGAHRAEPLPEA